MKAPQSQPILQGQTGTVTGTGIRLLSGGDGGGVFQATVDGTGAVTATVLVDGSINGRLWNDIGTLSLTGTTNDAKKVATTDPWPFARAQITAISGTGAKVDVFFAG